MGYKDRNNRRVKSVHKQGFADESGSSSNERVKARELRHSRWWKQKLADGICYYCGEKFSGEDLTMDHKIPVSRGGLSEKSNLVAACKECNNKKKYLMPYEWDEYLDNIKNGSIK